MSTAAILYGDH